MSKVACRQSYCIKCDWVRVAHNKRILRARIGLVVVGTVTYSEVGVSSPQIAQPLCGIPFSWKAQ